MARAVLVPAANPAILESFMQVNVENMCRAAATSLLMAAALCDQAHAQQLPANPRVDVAGENYTGTLCAPGTLDVSGTGGVDISTSSELDATSLTEGSTLEGSCDLTVELSVPEGFSTGNAVLCYDYILETGVDLPWTPAPAQVSLRYGFVGGEMRPINLSAVSGGERECVTLDNLWTACGSTPQLSLQFSATAPAGTYASWSGFSVGFSEQVSDWRTCSGEPVDLGEADLYEDCSQATGSPCKEGLTCEQRTNDVGQIEQACRVAGQELLPVGEVCSLSAQCQDGLFCGGVGLETTGGDAVCTSRELPQD
jgi:hypothetical protein